MMTPTSHHFVSQRLRLHYNDYGNSSAPPLILLHGGRDHARSWDWTAARFADRFHVVAPDLRGHGDSAWTSDGNYQTNDLVYDLARMVEVLGDGPVRIIAHSWGGNVAIRFAALYPDKVERLIAIEGLGPSPKRQAEMEAVPYAERLATLFAAKRAAAGRSPRRYATVDDALARMTAANAHLSPEQARHLTIHGLARNEDMTWSWKFDPMLNNWPISDVTPAELASLWVAVRCPTLLMYGAESWASNPVDDGRIVHFADARVEVFAGAGHWLHHDRFADFVAMADAFIA